MVTPLLLRLHISYVIIFKRKEGVVKKRNPLHIRETSGMGGIVEGT